MRFRGLFLPSVLSAVALLAAFPAILIADEKPAAKPGEAAVLFETDVLPLLQARCLSCHGEGKTKAGLDVRRKFTLLQGGDSGPALVPGKPGESLLLQRVENGEMPPPGHGKLDARQQALLRRWVAAGAPLARSPEPSLEEAAAPSRVSEEDRRFWAFQPPRRPAVPAVQAADRVRTPIDAFLLARLEAKGLSFNPDAPKAVLLRRLSFDLLGLPPTPHDLAAFLADDRPDAYERLVDRLLASPAYGERWGRHWLDVAGYADSDGYLAADRLRPEAWRYRDYVIRSLNDDVPYDRFLTEQLAGDELGDWRRGDELTPEAARRLTATGFLRTALDPTYPGYTEPNEIHQVLGDTLQIVGSATLGLTVHCARCHAHKFDPLSQRDYYALQAVFLPALDPARWQPSEVRGIPLATDAELARVKELNAKVEARLKELDVALVQLTARCRKKHLAESLAARGTQAAEDALLARLTAALLLPADKRNEEQKALVAKHAPDVSLAEDALAARHADYREERDRLKAAHAAEKALLKKTVLARGLTDLDGKPPEGRVLLRGDYNKPGPVVEPGVPEVLAPPGYRLRPEPGGRTTGRRLALARWLTDPAHPLTARVHVNRLWARHFGRGLVPTMANFGRSGARPSHPELLDWLATEFVRAGWSQKALHRLLVTSTAYRQSSAVDPAKAEADPDNVLLGAWRPRRHEGEVLRDSLLAVSGKLNGDRFGPPAPVVANADGSVETADDPQGNRRSVYVIVRRSQHLTLLDLFDTPLMEVNCPERNVSTVPLQALALLHGPFAERAAMALADRLLAAAADDAGRIALAYRLLFTREPRPQEAEAVRDFLAAVAREHAGPEAARTAWKHAALVLLNSNEFVYVH